MLYDEANEKLEKPRDIQAEVLKFYGSLSGSCAGSLPVIDIPTKRAPL